MDKVIECVNNKDLKGIASNMENILENVSIRDYPFIQVIKDIMLDFGAMNAHLRNQGVRMQYVGNGYGSFKDNTDYVVLMTYHSSKGLQFENVFLPDCTVEDDDNRNPLYVAVTRTYQSLYILHSGNLSSLFDDVPEDLYETSLASTGPKLKL